MTELYGEDGPPRGRARPDPARPPRHAARVRRRRLLPRLRRGRRTSPARRSSSTAAARAGCCEALFTPGRLLAAGARARWPSCSRCWVIPSNEYIFLPDRRTRSRRSSPFQGGHNPTQRRHLLRRRDRPQGDDPRAALRRSARGRRPLPRERDQPAGRRTTPSAARSTCEDMQRSQQIAAAVALKAAGKQGRDAPTSAR